MDDRYTWTGASGKEYRYEVFSMEANWTDKPGNYIYAKETSPGQWQALYIGETVSLIDELPYHEELACIQSNGATHLHVRIIQDGRTRSDEVTDLRANNEAPCNQ